MDANAKELFGMMYFTGGIGVVFFGCLVVLEYTMPGLDAYILGVFAGVLSYVFWQRIREIVNSPNGNSATKEDE